MRDDLADRSGARPRAGRAPVGHIRWGLRAVSGGLLVLATVMGVRLGLDGPAMSPVSPSALTARYGAPPTPAPAAPPVEAAVAPPAEAAAVPPVEANVVPAVETPAAVVAESVMQRGHQHDQHDGGGRD